MSCFLLIFKAQNMFEIKLVEVADYNSTNQDHKYLTWILKGNFLTLKKCQANWSQSGLNEEKMCTNPDITFWDIVF